MVISGFFGNQKSHCCEILVQAFSREPPHQPIHQNLKQEGTKEEYIFKEKRVEEKIQKTPRFAMPYFFLPDLPSYPFFLGHHDFNSAPKSTTLPKPWQMYKNRVFNHQDSEKKKKTHSMWRIFGHDFFVGGVNPPNPQSKAFFSVL